MIEAPTRNPILNASLILTRRCLDVVVTYSNTTQEFISTLPPGSTLTANQWLEVGSSGADTSPFNNTVFGPFGVNFQLDTLGQFADIQAMFAEYQVRKLTVTVQSLTSDDAGTDPANDNPAIPEIMSAYDPTIQGTLSNPILAIESYANVKRTSLTVRNKHVVSCRPRSTFSMLGGNAYSDNELALWYPTLLPNQLPNNYPTFFGIQMVVRNFPQYYGTALLPIDSSTMLRFSLVAEIAVRRPH